MEALRGHLQSSSLFCIILILNGEIMSDKCLRECRLYVMSWDDGLVNLTRLS